MEKNFIVSKLRTAEPVRNLSATDLEIEPIIKGEIRLFAILCKRPTEVGVPSIVATMITDDERLILKNPPPSKSFPRYPKLWRKQGAPVKVLARWAMGGAGVEGKWIEVKAAPIQCLIPVKEAGAKPPKKKRGKRKISEPHRLAMHFVKEYLQRKWTNADWGGMHVKHAKQVLGLGYTVEDVTVCLERLSRGDLTSGVPWPAYTEYQNFKRRGWFTLLCVLWGEPPAIERKPEKPGAWSPEDFRNWHEKRHAEAPILDEPEKTTAARDFTKKPAWVGVKE